MVEKNEGITNFICSKCTFEAIDCHLQPNYDDCAFYCAYNVRIILHSFLTAKYKQTDYTLDTVLNEMFGNDALMVNPRKYIPDVEMVKTILNLRKDCIEALVNISKQFNPNLNVTYAPPIIAKNNYPIRFPFIPHMGEDYKNFEKEVLEWKKEREIKKLSSVKLPDSSKFVDDQILNKQCHCTLVKGCLINNNKSMGISDSNNNDHFLKCRNCEINDLSIICVQEIEVLLSKGDQSHDYSAEYCDICVSNNRRAQNNSASSNREKSSVVDATHTMAVKRCFCTLVRGCLFNSINIDYMAFTEKCPSENASIVIIS